MVTLGCPKNQVDSEIMAGILRNNYLLVDDPADANVIVVNTCTFISDAKEESIDTILEMAEFKKNGNCRTLIAAGCLAQRYGDELLGEIPELDAILGTGDIESIEEIVSQTEGERYNYVTQGKTEFIYSDELTRVRSTPRHYAYIKIAEGCDNCCTYCVIPHVRGHFRSRSEDSILKEVNSMANEGVKEVLLIAQDTTRYGLDLYGELRLPSLIRQIASIEGIEWIRLMYCYPESFTDDLIRTISEEPKVCRYLDLPMQHADNKVLREMNRRGTVEEVESLIVKLRTAIPDITLRTTMITGFPGESEEEFSKMLEFIKRVKFDRLGAFAYSQEEGTPAAQRADQITEEVREHRRDILMSTQQEISFERQQRWIDRVINVIVDEKIPDGKWLARSHADAPEIDGHVYITSSKEIDIGDIVRVKIIQADSYDLMGEVVSESA